MSTLGRVAPGYGSDARRIRRVIGRWVGGGYLAYLLVCAPEIAVDAATMAPWWTPVAVLLAFGPGLLMLVTSFLPDRPRRLDVLAWGCGLGYLIGIVTWFVAWNGTPTTTDRGTWLVLFPGLASLALILLPWPWVACANLVVVGSLAQIASAQGRPAAFGNFPPIGDYAWAIAFSGLFVLAGIMSLRAGDLLDASRARVIDAAARASARRAGDEERAHYDALIHDRVLAVLVNVRVGERDSRLSRQAERAMAELGDVPERADAGAADLVGQLRSALTHVDDDIRIDVTATSPIVLPASAVRALVDATGEAVRNVARHAGGVTATVEVSLTPDRALVTVCDDGVGFDPASVRPQRMGIAASIHRRMVAAGGRATVDSEVGRGTRVGLQWPA